MPTIPSLLGSYIDQTYQRLVQVSGSSFADGLGNPISFGTPTLQQVTTAGSSSTNPINLLNSNSTFTSVKLYNYAFTGGTSGRGVAEFLTLGGSASIKIEPPAVYFKSSLGGNNALSFPGAGSQYNYLPDNSGTLVLSVNGNLADSAGNVTVTVSPTAANVDQINTPDGTDVYVRPQELEESKHTTINVFNFLNFT